MRYNNGMVKITQVVFRDGRTMKNVEAMFINDFLAIANYQGDKMIAPDFYHLDLIAELHGVESIAPQQRKNVVFL